MDIDRYIFEVFFLNPDRNKFRVKNTKNTEAPLSAAEGQSCFRNYIEFEPLIYGTIGWMCNSANKIWQRAALCKLFVGVGGLPQLAGIYSHRAVYRYGHTVRLSLPRVWSAWIEIKTYRYLHLFGHFRVNWAILPALPSVGRQPEIEMAAGDSNSDKAPQIQFRVFSIPYSRAGRP